MAGEAPALQSVDYRDKCAREDLSCARDSFGELYQAQDAIRICEKERRKCGDMGPLLFDIK
jgi:hypothetical protein